MLGLGRISAKKWSIRARACTGNVIFNKQNKRILVVPVYFPERTECSLNNGGARKSEVLTDINKLCTELVK